MFRNKKFAKHAQRSVLGSYAAQGFISCLGEVVSMMQCPLLVRAGISNLLMMLLAMACLLFVKTTIWISNIRQLILADRTPV